MPNLVIIDRTLTAPPSETYALRTLGTYLKTFSDVKIIVEMKWDERDFYNKWFKRHYFFDFVDDFVEIGIESGIRFHPYPIADRLVLENLGMCYHYFAEWHQSI